MICWGQAGTDATIPQLRIVDAPRLPYRGVQIDVARHFRSQGQILKLLDQVMPTQNRDDQHHDACLI